LGDCSFRFFFPPSKERVKRRIQMKNIPFVIGLLGALLVTNALHLVGKHRD